MSPLGVAERAAMGGEAMKQITEISGAARIPRDLLIYHDESQFLE